MLMIQILFLGLFGFSSEPPAFAMTFDEAPIGDVIRTVRTIPIDLASCRAQLADDGQTWFCKVGTDQSDQDAAGGPLAAVTHDFRMIQPDQHCWMMMDSHNNGYSIQVLDYYGQDFNHDQALACFDRTAPSLPPVATTTIDHVSTQAPVDAAQPVYTVAFDNSGKPCYSANGPECRGKLHYSWEFSGEAAAPLIKPPIPSKLSVEACTLVHIRPGKTFRARVFRYPD
jgi:hypothetical protein